MWVRVEAVGVDGLMVSRVGVPHVVPMRWF